MQAEIEQLFDNPPDRYDEEHSSRCSMSSRLRLTKGEVRAAEPDAASPTGWRVNAWVKKGILLGFRMGGIVDMSIDRERQPFFDKSTYPVKQFTAASGVRIVPGGSSIRDGCYIGKGVTCMPPMYINAGSVCGRRDHGRFACAGRKLRADRERIATFPRQRRSAACWSRSARCR